MMSGSGPTVFGLFREMGQAQEAADLIREQNLAEQIFVTDFYFPK